LKFPEAGDAITARLLGDLNKGYSELWSQISEFVHLSDDLPSRVPLAAREFARDQQYDFEIRSIKQEDLKFFANWRGRAVAP
jgi:hypothetical protein